MISVHSKGMRNESTLHKQPAAWFFVVDLLVKLCSHDSFKHILRLFWVGKKSATFCLSARKRVVSAHMPHRTVKVTNSSVFTGSGAF